VKRAELYKLHVYGAGDFFKPHVDTPRGEDNFGSLVVCLPTAHAGGALRVRGPSGAELTFDFARSAAAGELGWAAFYGDCAHEVLGASCACRGTAAVIRARLSSFFLPDITLRADAARAR